MSKTLDDYMKIPYPMHIIKDEVEGGYTVMFPDLPGCLTCGETIKQAIDNAAEAKMLWIEATLEDGQYIAPPNNTIEEPVKQTFYL